MEEIIAREWLFGRGYFRKTAGSLSEPDSELSRGHGSNMHCKRGGLAGPWRKDVRPAFSFHAEMSRPAYVTQRNLHIHRTSIAKKSKVSYLAERHPQRERCRVVLSQRDPHASIVGRYARHKRIREAIAIVRALK